MLRHHVEQELLYRKKMWDSLLAQGGPKSVEPSTLRAIGIYGGAQGVWVDKARTSKLTTDGNGITVGLLHTGRHYVEELSDDGVLYHYPETRRPDARDTGEIEATKNAQRFVLPVFVIAYANYGRRDVYLGRVTDWDDEAMQFLIVFEDELPMIGTPTVAYGDVSDTKPFHALEKKELKQRQVMVRQGQQRFRFYVLKRYGMSCAMCGLSISEILQATHIIPSENDGSDDPRNGLILCSNHRLAFEAGLIAIEPETLEVLYNSSGPGPDALQVSAKDLRHLRNKPHPDAIEWQYQRWKGQNNNSGQQG